MSKNYIIIEIKLRGNHFMDTKNNYKADYPVEIAGGIFQVGFYDTQAGLYCNPYLIIDNDEAVLIDAGSRPDFPTVMMKVLQTGINISNIKALIYHHYDPDLCGSILNLEDMINNENLIIISDIDNHMFIRHYSTNSNLVDLKKLNFEYRFTSGRVIKFLKTPYAHSSGSFISYDVNTGTVFTSDLFGNYESSPDLYLQLLDKCYDCNNLDICHKDSYCPLRQIVEYHKTLMPCNKALHKAIEVIESLNPNIIAPQHGFTMKNKKEFELIAKILKNTKNVGIDGIYE